MAHATVVYILKPTTTNKLQVFFESKNIKRTWIGGLEILKNFKKTWSISFHCPAHFFFRMVANHEMAKADFSLNFFFNCPFMAECSRSLLLSCNEQKWKIKINKHFSNNWLLDPSRPSYLLHQLLQTGWSDVQQETLK